MTSISFTSGELLDIISALELVEEGVYDDGDHQGAAYYQNMIQQFERISNKLQEFVPENRVANLVLAVNKMNTEVKQKWIDALRSGKYEQGSEKLRGANGYCCLGVLCDIYAQEHNTQWEFRGYDENGEETNPQPMDYWYFGDQSEFLPETVMNWAELKTHNPTVRVHCDDEDTRYYTDEIANVNDSGYDFSQIANIIEAQL